jgi:hypothetical protein
MKKQHDSALSHCIEHNKNVWKTFYLTWENDKILIFLLKDAPSKALQKLYEQIPIDLL